MTEQKTLLTAEEFFRLYAGKDGKAELVRGIVVTPATVSEKHGVEMAPVGEEHGEVAANISFAFKDHSRRRGVGRVGLEIGYVLSRSPDTVRAPDVSINMAPRTEGEARLSGFVPGAPDIAIEIVLPSATTAELEQKVGEYLAAGSQRVWVVYTSGRRVTVHHPNVGVETYSGDAAIEDPELLPGFSLPLAEIFE